MQLAINKHIHSLGKFRRIKTVYAHLGGTISADSNVTKMLGLLPVTPWTDRRHPARRFVQLQHRRRKGSVIGGTMASAEHERITGVWGQSPQRGPGAEPLVRGAKPPWSWKHFGHWRSNGAGKFSTSSWKHYVLLRSTGVRVGGAQSAWCPPNPVIGGPVPPGSAARGYPSLAHQLLQTLDSWKHSLDRLHHDVNNYLNFLSCHNGFVWTSTL